jgi:hypothetical protein
MLQAYEGYFESGRFYPKGQQGKPMDTRGRCNAILTLLSKPTPERADTWGELDKIVAGMDVKPEFEDFPRSQFGRGLINFEEV